MKRSNPIKGLKNGKAGQGAYASLVLLWVGENQKKLKIKIPLIAYFNCCIHNIH